jgi:tripartite-type tricarboxylate transporter receptor subunit TctC
VVVFARPDAPFSNLEELAEYAKENRIVYGHPGPASLPHLAMEEFFKKTGITTARSLPFRSAAPGVAALKSGNVDLYAAVSSLINTLGDDGRRQIIAVFDEKRLAKAPNAKTAKEQGFDHSAGITFGFVAPKGIPDTAHQKLSSACEQLSQSPGFVKTLEQQLVRSSYTDGPEFLDFLKSSSDKNRALIKEILAE